MIPHSHFTRIADKQDVDAKTIEAETTSARTSSRRSADSRETSGSTPNGSATCSRSESRNGRPAGRPRCASTWQASHSPSGLSSGVFAARYVPDCAATEAVHRQLARPPTFFPAIGRDDCSERTVMPDPQTSSGLTRVPADVPPPKAPARGDTQNRSHEGSLGGSEAKARPNSDPGLPEHALKALGHGFKEARDASFIISGSPFVPRGLS